MMTIIKRFKFDSAHFLPGHPKCGNIHGHTWVLKVSLEGEPRMDNGMVIDFHLVKDVVNEKIINRLDHRFLNELGLPFSEYPSCENIVKWIFEELQGGAFLGYGYNLKLTRVKLAETEDNYVAYYGK